MGSFAYVIPFLLLIFGKDVGANFCVTLFKEVNQTGEKLPLIEDSIISNFNEHYITVDSVWNSTQSFSLEKGCQLTVCNDTHFNGICRKFNQSLDSFPDGYDTILSASCACSRVCTCSNIEMRRTSCARAYLQKGCNVCNPHYIDLKGEQSTFPSEFGDNVASIKIRDGCNLTIFSEKGFDGEEEFVSESTDEWDSVVGSYKCSCSEDDQEPTKTVPRPPNYPALVDLPNSIENISSLLNGEFKRHPGLMAALESLKNKRCSKHVYILALGSTGAGKSSAINLLFDNPNVTRVGGAKSTTTDIHEFRINIPVDELGIYNSELRIIDTPGLGDTRGLQQDAMFLATLDEYLSNHEDLHDRIPNVVLIFHKFNDNRYAGEGSMFVKMLRGLDAFRSRITDDNYSNVIFVFSHLMSEEKETYRHPKQRLLGFKDVIEGYSLFPKPIIIAVAENKPLTNGLPSVNGYYELPNGEYYPRNLFEKIQDATERGGDPIGNSVIRTAFRDPDDFNISSITFKLVESGNNKISKYYEILVGAIINVENTEISQMLAEAHEKMDPALKIKFPESLLFLQKALNIRNIRVKADIPQTTVKILELLSNLKYNQANTFLLAEGLKIKPPIFGHNVLTGHSYNIFKDIPLPKSPFQLGEKIQSDIGYLFPSAMTCSLENQATEFVKFFPSKADYLKYRIRSLGIKGEIAEGEFSGEIMPGFNIQSDTFRNESCEITTVREFRTFKLDLNDKPDLTAHFESTLTNLPEFNNSDPDNVKIWNDLFDDYGTHVVSSVYGGGAIEIHLKSNKTCGTEMANALLDVIRFAEDLTVINDNSSAIFQREDVEHIFKFRGGGHAYHTPDLTKMTLDDASRLLSNWKKSLRLNPVILTSEIKLLPISIVARKVGQKQNISLEIERATSLRFNSSLRYVPPKYLPKERELTATAAVSTVNNDLVTVILSQHEAANKRLEATIAEMKQRQIDAEKRREEERKAELEFQRKLEEQRRNDTLILRQERERREEERKRLVAEHLAKQLEQEAANAKEKEKQKKEYDRMIKELEAKNKKLLQDLANSITNTRVGGNEEVNNADQGETDNCDRSLTTPLYRYWSIELGDHLYTTDWNELQGGNSQYRYEKEEARIFPRREPGTKPLYRYYNSGNNDNLYTRDSSAARNGYISRGITGYVYATKIEGSIELFRYYNRQSGDHFYTIANRGRSFDNYVREGKRFPNFVCPP